MQALYSSLGVKLPAAIVTTAASGKNTLSMRNRAQELGIRVFSMRDRKDPDKLARNLRNMYQ